ncbi:MltR family transcriptional regulator [Photobacterium frigidiphilum]|uniref:MltR family transcriptional regulator n=1 Tax=Photobacterium frigidiphilum TaxID=264736 RepID=A0A2T3JNF7_9GAMM|nr:MltR family transcriptional regulator [Photobacterium frigidiphilum]PSU50607.1 MltR family transcriptional regulator [Photobacterium frigidiphilum]
MAQSDQESDILERLSDTSNVRGFIITSVEVFEEAVDSLIQRIFRKDDFAVKSVVGPLLDNSGPLGEITVRLKLLLGLGVVSHNIYQDIDAFLKLRDFLNSDGSDYCFTDPKILQPIKKMHAVQNMGMVQLEIASPGDDVDLIFYQMQLARQEQIIKSALALAIAGICNELGRDSPF